MRDIPEISWPSGYVKQAFEFNSDFDVLLSVFSGKYFEDHDELGEFMIYYADFPNLGNILFIKHKYRKDRSIMAYVDINSSLASFLDFLKESLSLSDQDVVWVRPSSWRDDQSP